MVDHAIVIGIDSHTSAAWRLSAAVRDALAFAHWVTEKDAGRATPETLTLLISPNADATIQTELAYRPATREHIEDTLYAYSSARQKAGAGSGRLWFFYAGHGVAPEGGGVDEAPVLVPADVSDLHKYLALQPIGMTKFLRLMQIAPPAEQIYFIDACRGIVEAEDVVTSTQHLHFDLKKLSDVAAAQARQAVLYATTSGQLANEYKAHGLFGAALIEGLRGRGTSLVPDPSTLGFLLTFDALASFTKRVIAQKSEEARANSRILPTQEPGTDLFRADGGFTIARFGAEPGVELRVFVEPSAARTGGSAWIRTYDRIARAWQRALPVLPALPEPVHWSLPSGMHRIEIEAPGYKAWLQVVSLLGDKTIRASLVADGLETVGRLPTLPLDLAPGAQGTLVVETFDRYAQIEVFDDKGTRLAAGWEALRADLPVGQYRLDVSLPTESTVTEGVLVTTGETRVTRRPASALPPHIEGNLQAISAQHGTSVPSEVFGTATTTRLGSVLAWAAWAARFPNNDDGRKLHSIGVEWFAGSATSSYVQVVVADVRATAGIPGLAIAFGRAGAEAPVSAVPVPALANVAMQWHGAVPAGSHSVTIALEGLQPKAFPVAAIAGWVAVIVITRESSGAIEMQRYLNPLLPKQRFSDDIRRIEHSWRALESRTPLFTGEADALLGLQLDPLSLAVLGYRLAREGKLAMLAGRLSELEHSGLADGGIIAALARGTHDLPEGVPFLGEGYRLVEEWLVALAAQDNEPPPTPVRPFTGGFWTAFDTRGQRTEARAFSLDTAQPWAAPLRSIASATGRLEPGADGRTFTGTAFVVGSGVMVATTFSLEPSAAGWGVAFVPGAPRHFIEREIARSATAQIALLCVPQLLDTAPVLRWTLPHVGQRIAVIGHPMVDARIPTAQLAQFTSVPNGSKVVMPGVVVEVKSDRITYECWTMGGVAGGPVVDLDSNAVIAIHHSGSYEDKRKFGHGTPLAALIDDPMWEQAGISTPRARREPVPMSLAPTPGRDTDARHGFPPTKLSPREFMQHRRPDEFSDSSDVIAPALDRTQLEYHLSTISNRNEEFEFKNFARRVAQHEFTLNLRPHSAPTGGSNGEAFPVAEALALTWFESEAAAASERWGFAFSTEANWQEKLQLDAGRLVRMARRYTKVLLVSSQSIPDNERSAAEGSLVEKCGFDVRILDRGWLLDHVFGNHREQIALEELNISPLTQPKRTKGPRDVARESDLESTEARIESAVAAERFAPALVDECLRAAELSAALDRPRAETDQRFLRAQRMASRCGTKHQQLYVEYQWAWRTYFWFEDISATIPRFLRVEALALGTNNVFELELLNNLWNALHVACIDQSIPAASWDHEGHAKILKTEYERIAQDMARPSARLQAREQLLFLRLMLEGIGSIDEVAGGLTSIVKEATNLIGFPMRVLAQIVTGLGESVLDSPPFEVLMELIADTIAQREGDSASAKILLRRAAQQKKLGKAYDAIRTAGLTLSKLYKFETRELMLRALWLIGDAYEQVGLFWAARGTYLFAASVAANEFWRRDDVTKEQAVCYKRLKWLELRLGRIPQALSWHELERVVSTVLKTKGVTAEFLDEGERDFDAVLGIIFLKVELSILRECENMYDALEAIGLVIAPMSLVHALGHSNADIVYWLSLQDASRTADDIFLLLRDQPASDDLPEGIVYDEQVSELRSNVLGCHIHVNAPHDAACIEVGEAFVACFEAFLATALLTRITPHQSSITIHVGRNLDLGTPIVVEKESASNAWRIALAPSVVPSYRSQVHQLEISRTLMSLIIDVFARMFFIDDIENTMRQLGEDRALDRAVNFANGFGCIGNTLGNAPKFGFRDWSGSTSLSCVRAERWDARLPPKRREAANKDGGKPDSDLKALASGRLDPGKAKHTDMLASSVVDVALWEKAGWTGTLYGFSPDDRDGAPPIFAFLFENQRAGEQIFEQWFSRFGHLDERETIRISVIQGISRRRRHHYRVMVSSDPTKGLTGDRLRLFSVTSKMCTMEPDTSVNLDSFLFRFKKAKEFILVPGFLSGSHAAPDFSEEHYLRKRELILRNAWEVGIQDLERVAIYPTDDPIVPSGQTEPAVKALLRELRERQDASTVAKHPPLPLQTKNSLCKCGSGKKYKKCCGATTA